MFNFKRKTNFLLAISLANGCSITLRHGDQYSNLKVGNIGLRPIIHNFGNYLPFVFTNGTESWVREKFDLSKAQASKVCQILEAGIRAELKKVKLAMSYRPNEDCIPGTKLKWLHNDLRS